MPVDPYSKETETCQLCGNVISGSDMIYLINVKGKAMLVCFGCTSRADPIPLPTLPQGSDWLNEWIDEEP